MTLTSDLLYAVEQANVRQVEEIARKIWPNETGFSLSPQAEICLGAYLGCLKSAEEFYLSKYPSWSVLIYYSEGRVVMSSPGGNHTQSGLAVSPARAWLIAVLCIEISYGK